MIDFALWQSITFLGAAVVVVVLVVGGNVVVVVDESPHRALES